MKEVNRLNYFIQRLNLLVFKAKEIYSFLILFCALAVYPQTSFALDGADIAVYTDNGTGAWEDGIVAFENFLDWKGISHERITAADINSTDLRPLYQAIYFPGGYAWYYKIAISETGLQNIRDLVSSGGGYIGICAGAYFASDSVYWEEDGLLDYPLDLFDGTARGAIDAIAPWDNYAMTTLKMNSNNPINQFEPATEQMLYYGGPVFVPHSGQTVDTIAVWSAWHDSLAAINFDYGSGRVLLLGPHPEIEEDSDRDSTDFAQELDDAGSDWPFLWSAVDWLLDRPISYPPPSEIEWEVSPEQPERFEILQIYPNPFNPGTAISYQLSAVSTVRLVVYNALGQKVRTLVNREEKAGEHITRFNSGGLAGGIYFVQIQAGEEIKTRKIVLVK